VGERSVKKWVRKFGIRVGRRVNQYAESKVRRVPLDGMPCFKESARRNEVGW